MINCQQLAGRLRELYPEYTEAEIAQLCLLIYRTLTPASRLESSAQVHQAARAAQFRLDAVADQHTAMTEELTELFGDGPLRFSADQIWTLLRAVKVQNQLLELYVGLPSLC